MRFPSTSGSAYSVSTAAGALVLCGQETRPPKTDNQGAASTYKQRLLTNNKPREPPNDPLPPGLARVDLDVTDPLFLRRLPALPSPFPVPAATVDFVAGLSDVNVFAVGVIVAAAAGARRPLRLLDDSH